jgi:pyruvate/2-oxoglutarate dehydrogenase complex dihydrolipoamide acyltransferase (E2) component
MIEVRLPKLGTGLVAVITEWHVSEGERVASGQILATVDTEKVSTEIESPADGTVVELRASANEEYPVGTVVAILSPAGEDAGTGTSIEAA